MDSSGRRYLRWMTTRRYQLCIQIRAVPKLMLIEAEILNCLIQFGSGSRRHIVQKPLQVRTVG